LTDSEGKQLEAISFISRDAFGKYNRQFSTLKVFRNDESLRGKIRVVNYKWNFQPVARDQPSLLVTLGLIKRFFVFNLFQFVTSKMDFIKQLLVLMDSRGSNLLS